MQRSNTLHLRVELVLRKLLAEIDGELHDDGLHIQLQAGRWQVGMAIGSATGTSATANPERPLSPCERDCMEVIQRETPRLGRRMPAAEIDEILKREGRPWGWATLTAALSNLVAIGRLVNHRDRRGYGLATELKEQET